ncbi:hypothetical protein VPNG_05613 [Cytospora leucostoma]|uniref:Uncharacterized protein n=1 Tax=Cytospora leucostoma TaxID=1230097 RepID=A0A423X7J7_9PEZI|nr:hypothetical protein VPNG_05613 [Cytospora leucostoma]
MAITYGGTLVSDAGVGGDGVAITHELATTSSNATTSAMQAMTNALRFATSKSIRTSTIILASFNAMAALATAVGIIYGGYRYSKRAPKKPTKLSGTQYHTKPGSVLTSSRPSGLFFIHTVDVFPLVLSLGIAIQSATFAAAQSIGLQALLSRGCAVVAIFMLPALFIAPYIQLVFGVETAIRGLRSHSSARRQWTVTICLSIVAIFLLISLLVATADRAPDYCFASLFWIIEHYAEGSFVLFLGISIILIIAIITIILSLSKSLMIEPVERLAASRMVYYLILGFISNAFITPFFFSLVFLDQRQYVFKTLNMSMIASVVSNVNGLMVACLHLFLRSQDNSSIGRRFGGYEVHESKQDSRNSTDEDYGSSHALKLVKGSAKDHRTSTGSVTTLQQSLDAGDKNLGEFLASSSSALADSRAAITLPQAPTFPEPTQPPSVTSPSHTRKRSYSLFPNNSSTATARPPTTAYSSVPATPARNSFGFRPPTIAKPWLGGGHRRASSIESSATVQIGIRFSNVDDFQPSKVCVDTDGPEKVARPSPLAQTEKRPASGDARMKTLPPVPKTCDEGDEIETASPGVNEVDRADNDWDEPNQPITLGPSVYTPSDGLVSRNSSNRRPRVPSLAEVGFSTLSNRGNSETSSVNASPRAGRSAVTTPAPMMQPDWI